jgi:uncharacterized FlaG/YvyC family protein
MLCNLIKIRTTRLYLFFSSMMAISFAFTGVNISYAAVLPYMPETNQMISAGAAYELPRLVGLKFSGDNPFEFTFMLSKGDMPLARETLQREVDNISKYFLAALTLPEKDLWVNLSPYEQDRISTDELAQTDLGKDMLGEDYVLKQLVSSVTYPESDSGKKFWDDVYQKVQAKLGTTNIPVSTFNKVWIMPDKIRVVETDDRAAIDYAKLKVMMESDYLAMNKNSVGANNPSAGTQDADAISRQTMRDVIIPIIEEEVNNGKHFAHLRQIYSAIVMAVWFKKKLAKTILGQVYFDRKKVKGADVDDPQIRQKIYNEYTKAFRDGIYNYIRRDKVPGNNFKTIKRRYVSGGIVVEVTPQASFVRESPEYVRRVIERRGGTIEAAQRMDSVETSGVIRELAGTRDEPLSVLDRPAIRPLRVNDAVHTTDRSPEIYNRRKEQIIDDFARKVSGLSRELIAQGMELFLQGYSEADRYDIIIGRLGRQIDLGLFTDGRFKRAVGSFNLDSGMANPQQVAQSMRESQDYSDTVFAARQVLGREITAQEAAAVWKAHGVGKGQLTGSPDSRGFYRRSQSTYTDEELAEKKRILRDEGGLGERAITTILGRGVSGNKGPMGDAQQIPLTATAGYSPRFSDASTSAKPSVPFLVHGDAHGVLGGVKNNLLAARAVNYTDDGDWAGKNIKLLQNGDLIDRGPQSREVVRYYLKLQQQAKDSRGEVVILMGNHEHFLFMPDQQGRVLLDLIQHDVPADEAQAEVDKLKALVRDNILNGNIKFAHMEFGRLFVHGGLLPEIRERIVDDIVAARGIDRNAVTLQEVVDFMNATLVEAARMDDFGHYIFDVGSDRGGRKAIRQKDIEAAGINWDKFSQELINRGLLQRRSPTSATVTDQFNRMTQSDREELAVIFNADPSQGDVFSDKILPILKEARTAKVVGGPLWGSYSYIAESEDARRVPQVVAHEPNEDGTGRVRATPNADVINVDAGLHEGYGGGMGLVEFLPDGTINRIYSQDKSGAYKREAMSENIPQPAAVADTIPVAVPAASAPSPADAILDSISSGVVSLIANAGGAYDNNLFKVLLQAKVINYVRNGRYGFGDTEGDMQTVYQAAIGYLKESAQARQNNGGQDKWVAAQAQEEAEAEQQRQAAQAAAERRQRSIAAAQQISQDMQKNLVTIARRLAIKATTLKNSGTGEIIKVVQKEGKAVYEVNFNLDAKGADGLPLAPRWSTVGHATLEDVVRALLVGAVGRPAAQRSLYGFLGILNENGVSGGTQYTVNVDGLHPEIFYSRDKAIARINQLLMVDTIRTDMINVDQIQAVGFGRVTMMFNAEGPISRNFDGYVDDDGRILSIGSRVLTTHELYGKKAEFTIHVDYAAPEGEPRYLLGSVRRNGHDVDEIPLRTALARLNALPRNNQGTIAQMIEQERAARRGGKGDASGSMTEMGEPDQRINAEREQKRSEWRETMAQRWRNGDRGEARQLQPRDGPGITYTLADGMPDWLPADHFEVDGKTIYVVNSKTLPKADSNPAKNQRRDAIIADRALHEAQEHFWQQQGYSERDAHILAWYDQLVETGGALTAQQSYELEQRKGEPGLYDKFAQSDRTYHRDLIERVHGPIEMNQDVGKDYLEYNRGEILRKIGNPAGAQGGGQKGNGTKGGLDFAAADKMESAVQGNGVQLSGDKAMAYLLSGKVAGFRLATTKLTF